MRGFGVDSALVVAGFLVTGTGRAGDVVCPSVNLRLSNAPPALRITVVLPSLLLRSVPDVDCTDSPILLAAVDFVVFLDLFCCLWDERERE